MRQFGAYELKALLGLPFDDFITLYDLAVRAQADQALENVAGGMAAFHSRNPDDLLGRRDNGVGRDTTTLPPPKKFSREELAVAETIAHEYMEARKDENQVVYFGVGDLKP